MGEGIMTESRSFPAEQKMIKGKEYTNMKTEDFIAFFEAYCESAGVPNEVIDEAFQKYNRAVMVKNTRIKNKKEKRVLKYMTELMLNASNGPSNDTKKMVKQVKIDF